MSRIFISAVSSEFGSERRALPFDLHPHGHHLDFQEYLDHRQPGCRNLFQTLEASVRKSNIALFIIGRSSGAADLPDGIAGPCHLALLPDGMTHASYTQWEFLLAADPNGDRKRFGFMPRDLHAIVYGDGADGTDDRLQAAFLRHVRLTNVWVQPFDGFADLSRLIQMLVPRDAPARTPAPSNLRQGTLGRRFMARAEKMQDIANRLAPDSGRVTTQVLALIGPFGVGKTLMAIEHALHHPDRYSARLLVHAPTRHAMESNIATLTHDLGLDRLHGESDAVRIREVKNWLNNHPGWLLILDGADSDDALAAAHELSALRSGNILITTRIRMMPQTFDKIEVDPIPIDEATALLLDLTVGREAASNDEDAARAIAIMFGGLPLGLALAGAYIDAKGITLRDYINASPLTGGEGIDAFESNTINYTGSIRRAYALSVEALSPPARVLLQRLAWLASQPVPKSLLDVSVPNAEPDDQRAALAELEKLHLATRERERPYFSVPRVILDLSRNDPEIRNNRLQEVLTWLAGVFVGPQVAENWTALEPLAAHVEAAVAHAQQCGSPDPARLLLSRLSLLYWEKALYQEAEAKARAAVAIVERDADAKPAVRSAVLTNLALALKSQGKLAEAEKLYRRALKVDRDAFGPDDEEVAWDLNNLAALLRIKPQPSAAKAAALQAVRILERAQGKDHADLIKPLNNLALCLIELGNFKHAARHAHRSLRLAEANHDVGDPAIAHQLHTLALIRREAGELEQAEALWTRALGIDTATHRKDHPRIGYSCYYLSDLMTRAGRLTEAEPLARRAVEIFAVNGADGSHPELAAARFCLASIEERLAGD